MMCELIVKCITLVAVIHGLRILGRRIGPRASGMILGLPSSTAILLVLCGRERGWSVAVEMAEASLLGLVAAVSMPVAFAQAVRRGWRLPAALSAAIAAYVAVAWCLGLLHPGAPIARLVLSCASILFASWLASRIGVPSATDGRRSPSGRWAALMRTMIPMSYLVLAAILGSMASPRWAGLVSTFPSISMVVLAVTHLEEGPASASRIARALPPANLSTAAFLAAFRFGCPLLGLAGGAVCGFGAALINLAAMELVTRPAPPARSPEAPHPAPTRGGGHPRCTSRLFQDHFHAHNRSGRAPISAGSGPARRRHFAPDLEMLPC